MMDIILLQRVEKLGQMGDVVRVRPGYARNFLLPQKKALRATKEAINDFNNRRSALEDANQHARTDAEKLAKKIDGVQVIMIRQAGETGQLYGSVTNRDIADSLMDKGFHVERNKVSLGHPIKTLGVFQARVVLHPEVAAHVVVNVARTEEEAVQQLASQSETKADKGDMASPKAKKSKTVEADGDGESHASANEPSVG